MTGFASDTPTTDWLITGKRESRRYWWRFIGPFPSLEAAEAVRVTLDDADQQITFEMSPLAAVARRTEMTGGQ